MEFKKTYLLVILPLIYIALGFVCLENIKYFFLSGYDPSYAYLLNGTNLASGTMEIGHTDHPGTTVQSFLALVIFITYLFSGATAPLYQDVLSQPELYLNVLSIVLILLGGIITFL